MKDKRLENSIYLTNDWNKSSMIVIDGVHFVVCGYDDNSSFGEDDLRDGLQNRIHNACKKVANVLDLEEL